MLGFHPERGGYLAQADPAERRLVKGLAADIATILGYSLGDILDNRETRRQAAYEGTVDQLDSLAQYESELADLADLDGRIAADEVSASSGDAPEDVARTPMDEAIARLLPDMSEDPQLASELRSITQDSVAAAKAENLATFYSSLDGDDDGVWVNNDSVPAWLAASNDIRLVLAARLHIIDEASSEQVYERAARLTGADGTEERRGVEDQDDLLAVLFAMLTWWQESLVHAVGIKARRG